MNKVTGEKQREKRKVWGRGGAKGRPSEGRNCERAVNSMHSWCLEQSWSLDVGKSSTQHTQQVLPVTQKREKERERDRQTDRVREKKKKERQRGRQRERQRERKRDRDRLIFYRMSLTKRREGTLKKQGNRLEDAMPTTSHTSSLSNLGGGNVTSSTF